jgi:Uma2 family endonuclease
MQLTQLLVNAEHGRTQMRVQLPVRLSDISEPEPDFALVKPRADFYKKKHPGPADTFLIVEVSESSLRYDVQVKAPLYARHGVPEYWIIDLKGRQVTFFRSPESGQYADVSSTDAPGVVSPAALPEVQIDLAHVLDD